MWTSAKKGHARTQLGLGLGLGLGIGIGLGMPTSKYQQHLFWSIASMLQNNVVDIFPWRPAIVRKRNFIDFQY